MKRVTSSSEHGCSNNNGRSIGHDLRSSSPCTPCTDCPHTHTRIPAPIASPSPPAQYQGPVVPRHQKRKRCRTADRDYHSNQHNDDYCEINRHQINHCHLHDHHRRQHRRRRTSNSKCNGKGGKALSNAFSSSSVCISCDYCHKDITHSARILCDVCVEFDLCLECFSAGVELRGHKYWHSYRLIEDLRFSFLSLDWTASEEQLLLEGLELFGIGNWFAVANYVSSKDADECRDHYEHYYVSSPDWPEAHFRIASGNRVYVSPKCSKKSKCANSGRQRRATMKQKSVQKRDTNMPTPSVIHNLSGYMPRRKEFETEWDNFCEKKIMDIEFNESDTEEEFEMKMQMLEMYNQRLNKRHTVRTMAVEKKLHDQEYQSNLKKSRSPGEQRLHSELKRFLQIMTPEEYEELIKGTIKQKELEDRVRELQEYRAAGLSAFDQVSHYKQQSVEEKEQHTISAPRKKTPSPSHCPSPSIPGSPVPSQMAPVACPVSPPSSPSVSPSNPNFRLLSAEKLKTSLSDEERQTSTGRLTRARAQRRQQQQKEVVIVEVEERRAKLHNAKMENTNQISASNMITFTSYMDIESSAFLHQHQHHSSEGHNVFAVAVI